MSFHGENPIRTVLDAARALLAVYPGLEDAQLLRDLMAPTRLTHADFEALHKALEKYQSELGLIGYDYGSLVVPHTPWRGIRTRPAMDSAPAQVDEQTVWGYTDEQVLSHFPAGYRPRSGQEGAIRRINSLFGAGKRIVVLEMPTGGGKSFISYSFADLARNNGGAHFLTISKHLQGQYQRDFPVPLIELLKGRENYDCTHKEAEPGADAGYGVCTRRHKGILEACIDKSKVRGVTVPEDDGVDPGKTPTLKQMAVALELPADAHLCPYWRQLQTCNDAGVTLFNFWSFLMQQRIGRFGRRGFMIVDEAHNIEAALMGFVSMELTGWALSLVGVTIDRTVSTKDQFVEWIRRQNLVSKIDATLGNLNAMAEDHPEGYAQYEVEAIRSLQMKLGNFLRFLEGSEWVLETKEYEDKRGQMARKIVARPLYARAFSDDLLFNLADRVLVMSATILDVDIWARSLGLSPEQVGHVKTECDFPVENRPVFLTYAGNCGRKHIEETAPRLAEAVAAILERHSGQRGIIHTHSFDLSRLMRDRVASPRFLFQDQYGEDKEAMLAEHAKRPDSVIVAPAMAEGVDLKDGLGRFQIILKVPWPSLNDKVVKERAARDDRWYGWLTCLKLVQSYGRAVRSRDDWAYCYILDSGFEFFYLKHGKMLPTWFKEAIKKYAPKEIRHE